QGVDGGSAAIDGRAAGALTQPHATMGTAPDHRPIVNPSISLLGRRSRQWRKRVPRRLPAEASDGVRKIAGEHVVVHHDGLAVPRDLRRQAVAYVGVGARDLVAVL